MTFRRGQLEYFTVVVEEGQFTRAASRLHVAQPALSQSIAQLEDELGFKLLDRHPRGVSLTPNGEQFYEKARLAVSAASDAAETALSLARAQRHIVEWGFVVAPPGLHSPGPLKALSKLHPEIDIRFRELPFPSTPTQAWLAEVDVAVCHCPAADPNVWSRPLYRERRVVVVGEHHPLAGREQLTVEEVIDETFIGFHPAVEPTWSGFWSLDDHRGRPPRRVTADRAASGSEVLASLAVRDAITTAPASVGGLAASPFSGVHTIALTHAERADVVLVGREDRRSAAVQAVLAFLMTLETVAGQASPSPAQGTLRAD